MKKAVMVVNCTNPYPKSYFIPRVQKLMGSCGWSYDISFTDGTHGLLFANEPLPEGQLAVVRRVGRSLGPDPATQNDFYKVEE